MPRQNVTPEMPFSVEAELAQRYAATPQTARRPDVEGNRRRYEQARTVVFAKSLWFDELEQAKKRKPAIEPVLVEPRPEPLTLASAAEERQTMGSRPPRAGIVLPGSGGETGAHWAAPRAQRELDRVVLAAGRAQAGLEAASRQRSPRGEVAAQAAPRVRRPTPTMLLPLPLIEQNRVRPLVGLVLVAALLTALVWGVARSWPRDITPSVEMLLTPARTLSGAGR